MSFQTGIIQIILYLNMAISFFLLQPYFTDIKLAFTRIFCGKKSIKPFNHVLFVVYSMIFLVLIDSTYKLHTSKSALLHYHAEKNFLLSLFTLFISYVVQKVAILVSDLARSESFNKQNLKQHKNSMNFVNKVIEDAEAHKIEVKTMQSQIDALVSKIKDDEALISEIKNNKEAYLKLKDKYEKLREEKLADSRKKK